MFNVKFYGWLYLGGPGRDGTRPGGWNAEWPTRLPFVPAVGMRLGPTDAITVEEVFWLGGNDFEACVRFWFDGALTPLHPAGAPEAIQADLCRGAKTAQQALDSPLLMPWTFTWSDD